MNHTKTFLHQNLHFSIKIKFWMERQHRESKENGIGSPDTKKTWPHTLYSQLFYNGEFQIKVSYSLSKQRSKARINVAVEKQSKAVIFLTIPLILRRSISVMPFSFVFTLSLKTINKASNFRKSRWIN